MLEPLQKEPVQEIQQSLTAHFEEEDDPTQEIKSILNKRNLPNKNSDGNTQITLDFD